jgi:hypothetical protein
VTAVEQLVPAKPATHEHVPVEVQEPWPEHVEDALQNVQAGYP